MLDVTHLAIDFPTERVLDRLGEDAQQKAPLPLAGEE